MNAKKRIATTLMCALLAGCSTLGEMTKEPVKGWPTDLKITYHTDFSEVTSFCWEHSSGMQRALMVTYQFINTGLPFPLGCAWIDLNKGTCDVYYHACADDPDNPLKCAANLGAKEHEESHCRGYDHGGQLQTIFDNWSGNPLRKTGQ